MSGVTLLDPTDESVPVQRQLATRLPTLAAATIGLVDIRKARGNVFLVSFGCNQQRHSFAVAFTPACSFFSFWWRVVRGANFESIWDRNNKISTLVGVPRLSGPARGSVARILPWRQNPASGQTDLHEASPATFHR